MIDGSKCTTCSCLFQHCANLLFVDFLYGTLSVACIVEFFCDWELNLALQKTWLCA